LVVNEGGEREEIKEVGEESPHVGVSVFSKALVVKAVYLSNLPGFVVSTEDCYAVPVAKLESDEQCHGFDGIIAAIDVVAHEEVVGIRRVASDAEKLREIVLEPRGKGISAWGSRQRCCLLTNCP
jgi:hypothetical protein